MSLWRRLGTGLVRGLALFVAGVLLLLVLAASLLQTVWARNQLRALVVSQANHYLTATLDIGRLSGSLFRGIELDGVRLSRQGETLVAIDRVQVSYSIRELLGAGTSIRRLALHRPRITAAKDAEGRWDLAMLVRRDTPRNRPAGPRRPIRIEEIAIIDGTVTLHDPLSFGAAHVPSSFQKLNTTVSFDSQPSGWALSFSEASFVGAEPELTVRDLSGVIANGAEGWAFRTLHVVTPRSEFTIDGRVVRRPSPTNMDLSIDAPRFAFQEWAGVLRGLRNIAVESGFHARLAGPLAAMKTKIALRSDAGAVEGDLVLDTTVPGWHAKGDATINRLNVAKWLNRPERPSDISGQVALDIDLQLGGHFPRGAFTFKGSHAAYLEYEADDVIARGTITDTVVRIASATATAYGANVRLRASTLAIDAPYAFHFVGTAIGVDLRQVPRSVPVPHVESTLAFDYDVSGRFSKPFLTGAATFADSEFLGAQLGAGAAGSIDTQVVPFRYAGEGALSNVDLNHFGRRLEIDWLTEPRYSGMVRGRFHVQGTGSDLATLQLTGGGRLDEANLFAGRLSDADVSIAIANGSLEGSFNGELFRVDPGIAMDDPTYAARLTGHVVGRTVVRDLLVRSPELDDYLVEATLAARDSMVRGVEISRGDVEASITNGTMRVERLDIAGAGIDLQASGTLELDGLRSSRLQYRVTRSDLSQLKALLGREMAGEAVTSGVLSGPFGRLRFQGEGTLTRFAMSGAEALTTTGSYDATVPVDNPFLSTGSANARLSFARASGQELQSVDANLTYDAGSLTAQVTAAIGRGLSASVETALVIDASARQLDIDRLALTAQRTSWRLATGTRPHVAWGDTGVQIDALDIVDAGSGQQHLTVAGTWDEGGGGQLMVTARGVLIESLTAAVAATPARYAGVLDSTVVVAGTREHPTLSGDFAITEGRIRRLSYDRFAGHVDYRDATFEVDVRLDQTPGVWLTGVGSVPASVFDRTLPAQQMRVAVKSSAISLTLLEGVTDVVSNVAGSMQLDVTVIGTSRDPHFSGHVALSGASFSVVSSGAKYRNGRLELELASDRVGVQALHIEDEDGHTLDVTGSLGTHELRVGDLQVAVNARNFQVLRNEYGRIDVDAQLRLAGEFESPKLTGRLTVTGGSLNVDRILDRTLFQPYSTQAAPLPELDPIVALNPWDRMGMDIELHVPGTLRLLGENVQVSPGTPLGLGNINIRAFGDLYLYKDPAQAMYVNGSFDSLSGTYGFQGRRFNLDPASSINFRGDLNPEIYVTVNRVISGVATRVSIVGPFEQPELRLASTPPLDPSDILSLIVFNTSMNELSALQQQQLAVRAGTLAAGFVTAPIMAALERTLGLDTLEIEPSADLRGGTRVTVGNEIAPGLVARFSRQFGEADYDEATLEYYLSRIFRLRATFSDARTLTALSPFRRVERAGIDLLLFFSF